jgi:hypothetical protein
MYKLLSDTGIVCRITFLLECQTVLRLSQPLKDVFEIRSVVATTGGNIQQRFFRIVMYSYFTGTVMHAPYICVYELRSHTHQNDIFHTSSEHARFTLFSSVVI